ncbi:hypothetical protein [Azohydromonas australica]|uniref:hypothetical protein n=1 Tax=Azohydromonas australica TaxID=364039 RepID=UPI0012EC7710|nr:hypothetical protein [Azohydromonas australica]
MQATISMAWKALHLGWGIIFGHQQQIFGYQAQTAPPAISFVRGDPPAPLFIAHERRLRRLGAMIHPLSRQAPFK